MRPTMRVLVIVIVATCAIVWTASAADMVVLFHPNLEGAAQSFVEHRESYEGKCYPPISIAAYDVFDADTSPEDGVIDPEETKALIAGLQQSIGPLQYVLLIGDDELIPPPVSSYWSWDGELVDWNADGIEDIPIGRLPAADGTAALAMVEKILAYDEAWIGGSSSWRNRVLLNGYDNYYAGMWGSEIRADIELIRTSYLDPSVASCAEPWVGMSSEVGNAQARRDYIVNKLNAGMSLWVALGNRSAVGNVIDFARVATTSAEPIVECSDLYNDEGQTPFLIGMCCEIGQHASCGNECGVVEEMMSWPDVGILGAIAPTRGGARGTFSAIASQIVSRLTGSRMCGDASSIGDALVEAKNTWAGNLPFGDDPLRATRLLGDPSQKVFFVGQGLRNVGIMHPGPPLYPGSIVVLRVAMADDNYPQVNWGGYTYYWSTDNGRLRDWDGGWSHDVITDEPEVELLVPDHGNWEYGDQIKVWLHVSDNEFGCNTGDGTTAYSVSLLPPGGCPIVQAKVNGQWKDVNSVLSDRIYSGLTSDVDEYLHMEPPVSFGANPTFEAKVREASEQNYTMLDFAEIIYVEWPTGTTVLVSQNGSAFECDSLVSADTSWIASGADLTSFLAAEDTLHVTIAGGDTLFAVFADDSGTGRIGLPGVRTRTKPELLSLIAGGVDPWGIQMLDGFGVGSREPLLPRNEWSSAFADSPLVVRGDGLADTLAWVLGEVHQIDRVFLLDGTEAWTDTTLYALQSAAHSDSGNVLASLTADDGDYCRINYGQDTKLTFPYPTLQSGVSREIILHLRGTYQFDSGSRESPETEEPAPWGFQAIFPNPTTGRTQIVFRAATTQHRRLAVYDVSGRCIRTLLDGVGTPGVSRIDWDGRDSRNHSVAAGVYFFRLQEGSGRTSEKVVVLR